MVTHRFETVLFDLDGTLTDPGVGITSSVAYALEACGIAAPDKRELECFIGPPLHDSFEHIYNMSPSRADFAVSKYREYYNDRGIFENEVYPEIPELLSVLKEAGKTVIMATSKPECYAVRIAQHFKIGGYFDCIAGSELDGHRTDKAQVIEYALNRLGITDRSKCAMIGDRKHDIIGAKRTGLFSVGVLWGYGSLEELTGCGADRIVYTVGELSGVIL